MGLRAQVPGRPSVLYTPTHTMRTHTLLVDLTHCLMMDRTVFDLFPGSLSPCLGSLIVCPMVRWSIAEFQTSLEAKCTNGAAGGVINLSDLPCILVPRRSQDPLTSFPSTGIANAVAQNGFHRQQQSLTSFMHAPRLSTCPPASFYCVGATSTSSPDRSQPFVPYMPLFSI